MQDIFPYQAKSSGGIPLLIMSQDGVLIQPGCRDIHNLLKGQN